MKTLLSVSILASLLAGVGLQANAVAVVVAEDSHTSYKEAATEFDPCGLLDVICPHELSVEEKIRQAAREAGYTDVSVVLAVSFCESSWNEKAVGKVDKRDRGVFQINSRWNPDVTDECAFDAACSTKWFINELNNNRLWKWKASQPCWGK